MNDANAERWRTVDALCRAALELPPEARPAFLSQSCDDPEIRQEVESLLAFESHGDQLFEQPLLTGQELGTYRVLEKIGAGGMGEVYRANDSKLHRDVAIKLVSSSSHHEPEFRARLQREAQLLASLNHPNIAAVHGLEQSGDKQFIVMELVPGETLAERLKHGPLPVPEALSIAIQIAQALEEAHAKGVIHRDLKPANIKITPQDTVKVLDFGLAKSYQPLASDSGHPLPVSPADSVTTPGMIVGTAGYMSPEQALGQAVDKRTDIFALGALLFEMLTGRRAFDGEGVPEILEAVIKNEPDWSLLPAGLPPGVRSLLALCLEKNRKNRRSDAADVRIDIEAAIKQPASAPPALTPPPRSRIAWVAAAAAFAAALLVFAVQRFTQSPPAQLSVQFIVGFPDNTPFDSRLAGINEIALPAVSPDGQKVAFTAHNSLGKVMLWVRHIESLDAQALAGTESAALPFWSPDSRSLAFFASGKLKRVDASGGAVLTLCNAPAGRGGAWNSAGEIVFNPDSGVSGLLRVAATGGQPKQLLRVSQGSLRFPSFLPNGRRFLYLAVPGGLHVGSLDGHPPQLLFASESAAIYSAGHLLYVKQGTLVSQPFDPERLVVSGEPSPIADSVSYNPAGPRLSGIGGASGTAAFSASTNGVLAYRKGSGPPQLQMQWLNRKGQALANVGPPGAYRGLDLSPDGNLIAVHRHEGSGGDIWLMDARGSASRFTFDASQDNAFPVWTRDGRRIAFASFRAGEWGVYEKSADGAAGEKLLVKGYYPLDFAPQDKGLLFGITLWPSGAPVKSFLFLPPGAGRQPVPLLDSEFSTAMGQISPDGRWLAYSSLENGSKAEIYIKPFPSGPGKWKISTAGGALPRWSRDSSKIYYLESYDGPVTGKLFEAELNVTESSLQPGSPTPLFDPGIPYLPHAEPYYPYAISPDGKTFLVTRLADGPPALPHPITVVLNWPALRKN